MKKQFCKVGSTTSFITTNKPLKKANIMKTSFIRKPQIVTIIVLLGYVLESCGIINSW